MVGIAKWIKLEPDARSGPLLVTTTLIAPFAPALVVKLKPLAKLPAIKAEKSTPSVAVPEAVSKVKATL